MGPELVLLVISSSFYSPLNVDWRDVSYKHGGKIGCKCILLHSDRTLCSIKEDLGCSFFLYFHSDYVTGDLSFSVF